MVNRDIIVAKIVHIRKSLDRLKEKQGLDLKGFSQDRDVQDIVLLNLQVAIQGCIDIAGHIISDNDWGVPGSLAGLFDILYEKKVIMDDTRNTMRAMVGFKNLIVHEYAELDMNKVFAVFSGRLDDFNGFLKEISIYAKL
jgi:uncharacterized protein YutE (UPF0331/DUF86 family)